MFLDCASYILVVPPTSVIKLWLKNQIFTFLTSSLKPPADGASYYARRFPRPRPLTICYNYSEASPTGILAEL